MLEQELAKETHLQRLNTNRRTLFDFMFIKEENQEDTDDEEEKKELGGGGVVVYSWLKREREEKRMWGL